MKDIEHLFEEIGCKTDYEKLIVRALVFTVFESNKAHYGITNENISSLKEECYGEYLNTLEANVLDYACFSWSNDVEVALKESTGYEGSVFQAIFAFLKDREVK